MTKTNLKMELRIPEKLQRNLELLKTAKGNKAIRLGLRAASRVARKKLKKDVRWLRNASDESSGATFRAIAEKVSYPAKKTKGRGYYWVSVKNRHIERSVENNERLQANVKGKYRRNISAMQRRKRNKHLKGVRKSTKWLLSFQKTRLKKRRGKSYQERRPTLYWSVLNYGFSKRKVSTGFKGYNFTKKAFDATRAESLKAFERIAVKNIKKELGGKLY